MNYRALGLGALIVLAMNACSSGSSTIPTPGATIAPTAAPTGPVSVSTVATISTVAGQSVSAPAVQGFTPSITTPALSAPLSGTVTASTDVPAGIATFDFSRSSNILGSRQIASKPVNATVLLYVNIVPTTTTTASGDIAFSFALPNPPTGSNAYYLAFFDGHTWHTDYITAAGSLTANGVAFPSVTLPAPVTLIAGNKYAIALYSVPSNATPAPDVLLAPIPAKPPAGSPPLTSTLGAQQLTLDPGKSPQSIGNIRLLAGSGSVALPTVANGTAISYTVYDGIPPALNLNNPPKDGDVQGVLGITPAANLTFVKGSKVALTFTPDSGIVPKYELGLIIGTEAVTGGVQTDNGKTATVTYELTDNITFPANQPFYIGFGLSDGDFHNDDTGSTNKGNNQNPGPSQNGSPTGTSPTGGSPNGPNQNTGGTPAPVTSTPPGANL